MTTTNIKIQDDTVHYFDELDDDYVKERNGVTNLSQLRRLLEKYELIAWDALDIVKKWKRSDLDDFLIAQKKEHRKKYMGDELAERFSEVLIPMPMLYLTMKKHELYVPFGLVYRRLRDTTLTTVVDGRLILSDELIDNWKKSFQQEETSNE